MKIFVVKSGMLASAGHILFGYIYLDRPGHLAHWLVTMNHTRNMTTIVMDSHIGWWWLSKLRTVVGFGDGEYLSSRRKVSGAMVIYGGEVLRISAILNGDDWILKVRVFGCRMSPDTRFDGPNVGIMGRYLRLALVPVNFRLGSMGFGFLGWFGFSPSPFRDTSLCQNDLYALLHSQTTFIHSQYATSINLQLCSQ